MSQTYNILQVGLGPIGQKITSMLIRRKQANIVAAVDINPKLQNTSLGSLIGASNLNVPIESDLETCLLAHDIDIALVTTSSKASVIAKQIRPLLEAGISVITTCEELSFPWETEPEAAHIIDQLARANQCAVLGTGVNPGFLMDHLPASLTAISEKVDSIIVNRIQDASARRKPFQNKIGAGLSLEEFKNRAEEGSLRHVGLKESTYFIAAKLNWKLTKVTETLDPVMCEGVAQGVKQTAIGYIGSTQKIELNFIAAMNQANPEDRVIVHGNPSFETIFNPPVNGDTATTAITINAIPSILNAAPGLKTMGEIPSTTYW